LYIRKGAIMNLSIARWGNSLALRIPADYARRAGIKEGDSVEASLTVDGGISIRLARWNRKAFARELAMTRDAMPMGSSVMDELRRGARY
jgi:antitoxin MazE